MKQHKIYQVGLFVIVLIAVVTFGLLSIVSTTTQAAPPALPTPVVAPDNTGGGRYIRFQPATAIAADAGTTSQTLLDYSTIDIEYTIDQGTVNTTTLTVQYSVEGATWTNGVVLASANAADETNLFARVPIYGRYMRVYQDVTNSNPITITVTGVAR